MRAARVGFARKHTNNGGPLGCHLGKMLLREKTQRHYKDPGYGVISTCLDDLRKQLRNFEVERRLLIKLSETGRVVLAVQSCLETTLDILGVQETEESISWRDIFQCERNEWMERIKLLLTRDQKMKIEIGQSLEILTWLRYGIERYGDVLTPEELDVMSDVFDAVVHRSNVVMVELPKWFATSKHEWYFSITTPVWGTDSQISHDVDLWADLHHPHVRKFFGACHVGKTPSVIHEKDYPINSLGLNWKMLLGCARGLEYVHGCGLVHRSLTGSDFLLTIDDCGILSGLGLVRRSEVLSLCKNNRLFRSNNKQQPSPEREILAFGLCIVDLLARRFKK